MKKGGSNSYLTINGDTLNKNTKNKCLAADDSLMINDGAFNNI